ncbi:hypothetical protein UFOVP1672_44 [uncultured Caudovirales phage]|uniref:Uncharacterized protein n=1 Tax=uncultured Caudovirales phage TaxID=2100421 RepID=A0A6J5T8I9_9CAUD|nr:hypothetical protein UFOVP988_66 [uncultured Caudovirales phage]CAB4211041.1 hypothetical protein UFOVP1425_66 [uncultured Caudovirales phage]CAB4223421.1 hypothetical protein UFOVP1672_44 [uncultured Caudovirales phage]
MTHEKAIKAAREAYNKSRYTHLDEIEEVVSAYMTARGKDGGLVGRLERAATHTWQTDHGTRVCTVTPDLLRSAAARITALEAHLAKAREDALEEVASLGWLSFNQSERIRALKRTDTGGG